MSALLEAPPSEIMSTRTRLSELIQSKRVFIWGFVIVHLIFLATLMPAILNGDAIADVLLYRSWAFSGFEIDQWPGIQFAWVYPAGALLPIGLAGAAGIQFFQLSWFVMTTALNALSMFFLVRSSRPGRARFIAAWWWLAVVSILAPVSLLRLEGIAAPLVVIGLCVLAKRPFVASVLLTGATWIKVWPIAILIGILATGRRWLAIVGGALVATAAVVGSVFALGGLQYITSFVTAQTDRGLQLEAPISTPWVWMSALGIGKAFVWLNVVIQTEEVSGPGDSIASAVMDPAMLAAIVAIAALIVWARFRGVGASSLIMIGSLALVTSMFVFNKVGSPQYMLWFAPIIAVALCSGWRQWRTPAILMLVISALTSLVFPIFYIQLEDGNLAATALLTCRNALVVALLVWAVRQLIALVRQANAAHAARQVLQDSAAGGDRDRELGAPANLPGRADRTLERAGVSEMRVPDRPEFPARAKDSRSL